MLKLDGVCSGFGSKTIIQDVSLRIKQDDIAVVIGPNGAGKSTLLKTIFGIVSLSSGRISFSGEEIMNISSDLLVRKGIGYVPQGRVVFPSLTVEENIRIGGYLLSKHDLNSRLKEIFLLFPVLERKRSSFASDLSGGQQQMVSIARSLMLKPRLLLLDEPSLGLAPIVMREIFDKIVEINQSGTCVVLVEQNAHQAVKIASKIVVLDQGRVAFLGGPELIESDRIKELYLGH